MIHDILSMVDKCGDDILLQEYFIFFPVEKCAKKYIFTLKKTKLILKLEVKSS